MTLQDLYSIFLKSKGVSTDTRQIIPGSIFFALKGANFNGNSFAREALNKGAVFAVIDEPQKDVEGKSMLVPDVLQTLQQLANHHRRQFNIPVLAITGSNGKRRFDGGFCKIERHQSKRSRARRRGSVTRGNAAESN